MHKLALKNGACRLEQECAKERDQVKVVDSCKSKTPKVSDLRLTPSHCLL